MSRLCLLNEIAGASIYIYIYMYICTIYTVDQILYLVGDTTLLQLTTDFEKKSKMILVSVCVGGLVRGVLFYIYDTNPYKSMRYLRFMMI